MRQRCVPTLRRHARWLPPWRGSTTPWGSGTARAPRSSRLASPADNGSVPDAVIHQALNLQSALAKAEAARYEAVQQADETSRAARIATRDALGNLEAAHNALSVGVIQVSAGPPQWGEGVPLPGIVGNCRDQLAAALSSAQAAESHAQGVGREAKAHLEREQADLDALAAVSLPLLDPDDAITRWVASGHFDKDSAVFVDDAFSGFGAEVAASLITALSARGCQVIYLTEDPAVLGWAIALPHEVGGATTISSPKSRSVRRPEHLGLGYAMRGPNKTHRRKAPVFRHIRSKMIAAFAVPLALLVAGAGLGALSSAQRARSIDQQTSLSSAAAASVPAVQALEAERAYAVLAVLAAAGPSTLPTALRSLSPRADGFAPNAAELEAATNETLHTFQAAAGASDQVAGQPFASAATALGTILSLRRSWEKASAAGPGGQARQEACRRLRLFWPRPTAVTRRSSRAFSAPTRRPPPTSQARPCVPASKPSAQACPTPRRNGRFSKTSRSAATSDGADAARALDQAKEDFGTAENWRQRVGSLSVGPYESAFTVTGQSRIDADAAADLAAPSPRQLGNLLPLVGALTGAVPGMTTTAASAPAVSADAQVVSVLDQQASSLHQSALLEAIFVLVLDGAGILAGLVLVLMVSRSVVRPLVNLVRQADELARTALPATVHAILEAGASSEEPPQVPSVQVKSNDEVADMARALDAVNKAAVDLALGQAELRNNLAEAFVNLGRANRKLGDKAARVLERDRAQRGRPPPRSRRSSGSIIWLPACVVMPNRC